MLYLSGIILSFFLSSLLLTKRSKTHADYILVAWLAVTGLHLFCFYLFFSNLYTEYPTLVALGFPLPLAQGPFLYLYTCQQTSGNAFNKKKLLHFLPLLLSYLMFSTFYFMPLDQKVKIMLLKGKGYELQGILNEVAIYCSGVVYIALSLITLFRYRRNLVNQFSNTDKINFNWLLYMIIWMAVIWTVVLFLHNDKLVFSAAAIFVVWIGFFGIRQTQVFNQNSPQPQKPPEFIAESENAINTVTAEEKGDAVSTKYLKSPLTEQDASSIYQRLKILMEEQKPFKNPNLTLNELASNLMVHPNYLSQVINSKEQKNFYDLINEKRVEEFTKLISRPAYQKFTLMGIAYDCGFNSKASFNRNFKKYTGLTPSEFLKKQPQSES